MTASEMLAVRRVALAVSLRRLMIFGISAVAGSVLVVLFSSFFASPSASAADERPSRLQQTTEVTDVGLTKNSNAPTKNSPSGLLTQLSAQQLLPIDDVVTHVETTAENVTDIVVPEEISPMLSPQSTNSAENAKPETNPTSPIVSLNTGTTLLKASGDTAQKLTSDVLSTSATAATLLDQPKSPQSSEPKTSAAQTPRGSLPATKATEATRILDTQQDTVAVDDQVQHPSSIPSPEKNDALPLGLTNLTSSPGAGVGHDNGSGSRLISAVSPSITPLHDPQLIETVHHDQGHNVVKYNDLPDTPPD